MHLRPMERRDLPEVGDITAELVIDDPSVTWLAPRAHEYPEQFRANVIERQRHRLVQRQIWGIVSVSDKDDVPSGGQDSSEVVTGFAWWKRCNSEDPALAQDNQVGPRSNGSLMAAFERMLLNAEDRYNSYLEVNKVINYKRQALSRKGLFMKGPSVELPPHWFLAGICVHSAWQRKGIGQRLLQWGLDQASKEDMPVILASTPEGRRLYNKNGFKVVDALGLPENLPAEPFLIWDPAERWTRKLEESDASEQFGIPLEVAWSTKLPPKKART